MIRANKNRLVSSLILILLMYFLILMHNTYLFLTVYLISLIIIFYKSRKNAIMLFFSFILLLYSIPFFLHYLIGISISAYKLLNASSEFYNVLVTQTIFLSVVAFFLHTFSSDSYGFSIEQNEFNKYRSNIIFYLMIVCMIICIVVGKSGNTIFEIGGYGNTGKGTSSAVFEYFYIFFLLGYISSNNSILKKNILIIISIIFAFKSLLYGGRIEIMQLGILFLCTLYKKTSPKKIMFILLFGYFALTIYGNFRSGLNLNISSLLELLGINTTRFTIVNNEADVIYSSTVLISSISHNIVDTGYRIISGLLFFIKLIVPTSFIDSTYNVIPHLQQIFTICGGGAFFSSLMYFHYGYIGVFISAKIITMILNKISANNEIYLKVFLILFITMIPRWFAYSPEAFFKIPLYGVIVYFCITNLLKKK